MVWSPGFSPITMASILERIETKGIAELSYLIGDDEAGVAAVIDPRADVEIYLQLARRHHVAITHVFETHIHADFVSGARELAARCGAASVYASIEGGAEYDFEMEGLHDGDTFEFGDVVLTVRHTPGHTPEHVSYEATEKGRYQPWGVFTGDSLFVYSAGRPDLLGKDADKLASQLYDTLFGYFAQLDDGVIIYPGHGHGSPCGADIGDRLASTIGYLAGGMTAWDNIAGPLVKLPQMTAHEVETCGDDLQVLDVRAPSEWEAGHVPCATHLFVPEIRKGTAALDPHKTTVTYCATGYRASIAASLLQQRDFRDVRTMPGSWMAWRKASLPVSRETARR